VHTDNVSADPGALPESTQALLDAVTAISSDLDLRSVLSRIVEAATRLTSAQYGALGVLGGDAALAEFITTGLDDEDRARIGELPHGRGILGLLIRHPTAIRLVDLTQHPDAAGFPPNHPPMASFLGVPVRIRGTVFGNLYLTEKAAGQAFTREDELLVEALAITAGFVIDNARAYGLSERRRQWLEAAATLDEAVQPPIEFGRALREVARAARTMAGARAVGASISRKDTPPQLVTAHPSDVAGVTAALDVIVTDPTTARTADPFEATVGDYDALVVPLRTHLAGDGLLVAFFDPGSRPLPVEDSELFVSFADQAALALDRAQGLDDRAELAVTSDRERIARDLHDLVIQRLFATGLQLQRAEAAATTPEVAEIVRRSVDALDATIKDIRGTIFELQRNGSGSSLRADLRALAHEYAPLLKFDPVVRTTGPVDASVPPEIREHLLPVLREALSNLARHAAAKHGEIEVSVDGAEVRLSVVDDGVGMRPGAVESGLRNARRRAIALGGQLELTPRAPRGTSFVWRVPLH
jgi:two-component system, NarL family, sensor histidine kinase DevS